MNEISFDIEEYIDRVQSFHGHLSPGVIIGGFMVYVVQVRIPEGRLYNAICETPKCLPDAIQLLTPCTVGNGRLRIINIGRFALSLYDKYQGNGFRVFLDLNKLEHWTEIKAWFFRLKPKAEQNHDCLMTQIIASGERLCGVHPIQVHPRFLERQRKGRIVLCPSCEEAYPVQNGNICQACQEPSPYLIPECLEKAE